MRTTLKIVLPLIVSVGTVSLVFAGYQIRNERRILRNDLARRAEILAVSLRESVEHLLDRGQEKNLQRLVERYGQREHLKGIVIYDDSGHALAMTPGLAPFLPLHATDATRATRGNAGVGEFLPPQETSAPKESDAVPVHVYALPLHRLASFPYPARCLVECADSDSVDQPAGPGACALDLHRAAHANRKIGAHAAHGTTQPASRPVAGRNHGTVAPRGHAPGQGLAFR